MRTPSRMVTLTSRSTVIAGAPVVSVARWFMTCRAPASAALSRIACTKRIVVEEATHEGIELCPVGHGDGCGDVAGLGAGLSLAAGPGDRDLQRRRHQRHFHARACRGAAQAP